MFYRKTSARRLTILLLPLLASCSDGLLGGNITAQFAGINKATVMGPTSVSIDWKLDSKCSSYEIYALTASTTSRLRLASVPPVILNAQEDQIQSETSYSFAVGCNREGKLTGLDVSTNVSTWREFDGVISNPESLEGGAFRFTWDYPQDQGTRYLVYAIESLIPGAPTQLTRKNSSNFRIGYQDEPICTTFNNRITLGPGGECNPGPSKLKPGSLYQFHVVAQYPDNNYSNNLASNAKSKLIDPSFEAPNCNLTQLGLGPEAGSTYLYLRCSDNGAANSCGFNNITARAYQGIGGVRNPISGELTLNSSQSNILQIQATPGLDPTNERLVKNLEVEYTCRRPGQPIERMVVRYDNSNGRREPLMKYGNSGPGRNYETAPEQSVWSDPRSANPTLLSPSRMGESLAVGDFDCDGNPDLAVGLPNITYNQAPYFNENPSSGAVKIYYNYSTSANGTITAANGIQMLTFGDLLTGSRFGASLSAGNINKDVAKSVVDNFESYYSCDDLIIGAPGNANESLGRAFIFYGQRQRFPNYPVKAADLPKNSPTCSSSSLIQQNCTPVELITSDYAEKFRVHPDTHNINNTTWWGNRGYFGHSVAYLRDFNADGYGDVAVSDPNCSWDGYETYNGFGFTNNGGNSILDVGCVYVYFGGKEGIQTVDVGVPVHPNLEQFFPGNMVSSPYIKVYPPFIQAGMHFGTSIAAGGDIDGRLPVPIPVSQSQIALANGYDFVVGAPDFSYASPVSNSGGQLPATQSMNYLALNVEDPYVRQADANYSTTTTSRKNTPPINGAWTNQQWSAGAAPLPPAGDNATSGLRNSTGIVFAYFGRSALQDYNVTVNAGANWFPEGNGAGTISLPGGNNFKSLLDLFSGSIRDRQGHRGHLALASYGASDLAQIRPTRSFFNCGTRGAPTLPANHPTHGQRIHHYSCLAGRNNFSAIFPHIKHSDPAVSGFGSSLSIAGTEDSNLIAQYHLSEFLGSSSFAETSAENGVLQLIYNAQGQVHQRIRGHNMWEVAVRNFSGDSTIANLASNNLSSGLTIGSPVNAAKVRRSALNEFISMDGATAPTGGSRPQMDLNRDGYGDVVVGSRLSPNTSIGRSTLSIHYGNFAGDFSYAYGRYLNDPSSSPSTSNSSCLAQRGSSITTPGPSANNASLTNAATAFSTFQAQSKVVFDSKTMTVSAEFPNLRLPSNAGIVYFVDGTDATTSVTSRNGASTAGSSCKPQIRTLLGYQPSSLASADVNGDGMSDMVAGYAESNGRQGSTSVLYGNPFNGVGAEGVINTSSPQALFGSSVAASSWKFLLGTNERRNHEHLRRDVWVGARGRNSGEGAVFAHSSSSTITADVPLNTAVAGSENPFTDSSNSPNRLYAETSRIIGDINGDGFDEILVPVKRVDLNGAEYFDGMIYFGSSMGPVTNSFCRARISEMRTQPTNGQTLSASECFGSVGGSISAYINGTLLRLPQYLERPTGVGPNWIRHSFRAGDVNKDGREDLVLYDQGTSYNQLYLFFGSESGIINGEPLWGVSANRNPQKVATNVARPQSDYELTTNMDWQDRHSKAVAYGDFNADGYADFALGQPSASSPALSATSADGNGRWDCSNTYYDNNLTYTGLCEGTGNGSALDDSGHVVVFYGSSGGYQTPSRLATPIDAQAPATCGDYLTGCTSAANSPFREVYGSLYFSNSTYRLRWSETGTPAADEGEATCNPDAELNNGPRNCGSRATVIRSPFFHNFAGGALYLRDQFFGTSLAAGDFNGDGITDLAVGAPRHQLDRFDLPGWANEISLYGLTSGGGQDTSQRGSVFLYYGSRGGVVAPRAQDYYGDTGMGLSGANLTPVGSRGLFALSPEPWNSSSGVTQPTLDGTGSGRKFGMNMAVGDFNGDSLHDLVVNSSRGQLYVYYGPLCNVDNSRAYVRAMYANAGLSMPAFNEPGTPVLSDPGPCPTFNLNNYTNRASIAVENRTKRQIPQTIALPGINPNLDMKFGSVLLASLPSKGGNINGDPGIQPGDAVSGTSDLIVGGGGPDAHDTKIPRVGGRRSGIGFILFGHSSGGALNSRPGLFASAPADYNSTIFSSTSGNQTRLHFSPLALRPYEANGSVGIFFLNNVSLGDLNGDKTGDLLMPTVDIDYSGHQATPVISGGGFKLMY